jgi:hypothetical protein
VVSDPDGAALGVPVSIQRLLPGRPATAARDIGRWLDGMADAIRPRAEVLGVDQSRISRIEHDQPDNYELIGRYRSWLDDPNTTCAA